MNKKKFIKNQKIEKALGSFRPIILKGDKLDMFQCQYRVVGADHPDQVFLEDENGVKLAIPRNKLELLLKKGCISKINKFDIHKAMPQQGTNKAQQMPGTVHKHADGFDYQKVRDGVWLKLGHGTLHKEAGGDDHDHLSSASPKEHSIRSKMKVKIDKHAHPKDREKLHADLDEHMKHSSLFNHVSAARKLPYLDEQGNAMENTGSSSQIDHVQHSYNAEKKRSDFIENFNSSVRKHKGIKPKGSKEK